MAITCTEVAYNARFSFSPNGGKVSRTFFVDGLDPKLPDNCVRAVTALNQQVVGTTYQLPHPTVGGFYVMGFDSKPGGTEQSPNKSACFVDVIYGTPDFLPGGTIVEISSMSGTREMNRWPYGPLKGQAIMVGVRVYNSTGDLLDDPPFPAQISADYVRQKKKENQTDFISQVMFQTVSISAPVNGVLMRFTRRENNPPDFAKYNQKVNSTRWQSLDPGLWALYSIQSRQITSAGPVFPSGGYETTYSFQTAPDLELGSALGGFRRCEMYRDQHTGTPLPGIDPTSSSNNGFVLVSPFNSADFNGLGLPNVY